MSIVVVPAATEALRAKAFALRHAVFVEEQAVPVALDGTSCVGTGRLVRHGEGVGRVGRMAVDRAHRRQGIGDRVLEALEARARAEGLREIELHAQCYVEAFYLGHGYARRGEEFEEAGIAHVVMRKAL